MKRPFFIPLILFIISFIVYFLTSAGHTPYDYFTRLSDSFLQGKYYLETNPPWLNELIPSGENKFFVAYPPMPAIVALPFRIFFKNDFYQEYLAFLLGSGVVLTTYLTSWQVKKDKVLALWSSLLIGFGSIVWFLSSVGSSWYLGQISCAFFMSLVLYLGLTKRHPFLIGFAIGAMYLSRIHSVLAIPLFLYLTFDKHNWLKNYFYLGLGILPFVLFNFSYNFIRFGVIWDKAYALIPGVLEEHWYSKGLVNLSYIPRHIEAMFYSLPIFTREYPYIKPSWAGLAIWITTPAFIYSLFAGIKERVVQFSWISIALVTLLIWSHGTTGFAQFGYRFAVDFYPILTFLTIKGVIKTKGVLWHHWFLLIISILVNLWGVIWINKLGWVSF